MEEDNLSRQVEEVEALTSIYGDEWCVVNEAGRIYCISINDGQEKPVYKICLQATFPPEYPTSAPPFYQLQAPWLRGDEKLELANELEEVFCENLGESIIFLWVEKIREFLQDYTDRKDKANPATSPRRGRVKNISEETDHEYDEDGFDITAVELTEHFSDEDEMDDQLEEAAVNCPEIYGTKFIISDRRSTFTAHLAKVTHRRQVDLVLDKLLENKKFANATHNIYAYRIQQLEPRKLIFQGCEDDGEIHAGSRMLHLMQIIDAMNVMVIVTRWYGGVHLGPDRFKHINNCLRNILVEQGYIKLKEEKEKKGAKGGKRR